MIIETVIAETATSGSSVVEYVHTLISGLGLISLPFLLMPLIGKCGIILPPSEPITAEYLEEFNREISASVSAAGAASSGVGIDITGVTIGGIAGAFVGMPFLGAAAGAILGPSLFYESKRS